jgi:hypothetical protein
MAELPRAFNSEAEPFHKIYAAAAEKVLAGRILRGDNPQISITEHHIDQTHAIVMFVNNDGRPQRCHVKLTQGWKAEGVKDGHAIELAAHDGLIIELSLRKG